MSQKKGKAKKTKTEELIAEAVEKKMEEVGRRLILEGRKGQKNWSKMTQKRLYAYPVLKHNIERYRLDIEDIKKEDMGKSKSIVEFYAHSGGGEKPDLEELREAKIRIVEMKIDRDEKEIAEIDAALATIKDEKYYSIIEMRYFQKMEEKEIIAATEVTAAMLPKELGRLLDMLNVCLYGADALAK